MGLRKRSLRGAPRAAAAAAAAAAPDAPDAVMLDQLARVSLRNAPSSVEPEPDSLQPAEEVKADTDSESPRTAVGSA